MADIELALESNDMTPEEHLKIAHFHTQAALSDASNRRSTGQLIAQLDAMSELMFRMWQRVSHGVHPQALDQLTEANRES